MPNDTPQSAQSAALKSLLNGRSELAETRLSVTAIQIVDRLRIRSTHLQELMAEELAIDSKLLQLQESPGRNIDLLGLESQLEQKSSQVQSARRREDTECWRDLTHVMRDFLNAWEGFSRNEAKNRFLSALPDSKNKPHPHSTPAMAENYHHDVPNNPYFKNQR